MNADLRLSAFIRVGLATYLVANVFDCFSNFPAGFAEAFFYFATGMFCLTLSLEIVVVEGPANTFFGFAFSLIPFSFQFVSIR
jgi:hypothetical protein